MSEWQPIESAPKDGTFIEGYSARTGQLRVTRWCQADIYEEQSEGWSWQTQEDGRWWNDSPSHWRRLPGRGDV